MYYYGYFRNNDTSKDSNGQLYKVIIITNFQNEEFTVGGELTLSDTPFTVEYKSEDSRLHKPYKCSMATVGLYQSEINYNFNSTRGNDVYVALLKLKEGKKFKYGEETVETDKTNYTVEWVGFATPNAYSQNYETDFDLYELECQDALSTLQYFNYKPVNESNEIVTFYDIIRNMVSYLGTYSDIYITDGVKVPVNEINDNITNYLCINESNFYDEDGKPEKMLDVLDSILQYLTLTIVPYQDKLYILNYDVLVNGYNQYNYIKYKNSNSYYWVTKANRIYSNWVNKGIVELDDYTNITPELFAESGTKFSLGETFNSVKVVDDFYYIKDIDTMDNVKPKFVKSGLLTHNITQVNDSGTGVNKYSLTVNESKEAGTKVTDGNGNVFFHKYYEFESTPDIEFKTTWWKDTFSINEEVYSYDENEGTTSYHIVSRWDSSYTTSNKVPCYDTILNYTGAIVVDEAVADDNLNVPTYKKTLYLTTGLQKCKTGGYSHYQLESFFNDDKARKQNVLEITLKNQVVTKDDYIVLNGDYTFYKIAAPLSDYITQSDGTNMGVDYVWAQLECNGKFWDGTQWQTNEPTEKVFLNGAGWVLLGKLFKLHLEGNASSAKIPKNVGYPQGLTVSGWGVKVPYDGEGFKAIDVKLTLFRTFGLSYYNETELTKISNFEFNIYSPVKDIFNSDSNTEYTNTIDSESIEEYPDVNFNVTTWDGKDKDYSTVYYKEADNNLDRLKTTFNLVTGELITSEEHCISSICRQYNKPNTMLTVHLKGEYKPYSILNYHFFNGKDFVVDSISIDYAENNNTLTLVEKLTDNVVVDLARGNKARQYQRNGDIIFKESLKKDSNNIEYTYNASDLPTFELNNDGNLYIIQYGNTTL